MSLSGIGKIYVAGVDWSNRIEKVEWTDSVEGMVGALTIKVPFKSTVTWTPYQADIRIEDNAGTVIFFGKIKDHKVAPSVEGQDIWTITIQDYKSYYKEQDVQMNFENALITDVFSTLITTYTSDLVGTVYNPNETLTTSFPGTSLTDAINQITEMCSTELHWIIEYDIGTGKPKHHLLHAWQTSLATTIGQNKEVDVQLTQPFQVNVSSIKNSITIIAQGMQLPNPRQQMWLFGDTETEAPDGYDQDWLGIPLSWKPESLQCFLLYGAVDSFDDLYNCQKWELPIDIFDPNGREGLPYDVTRDLKTWVTPDLLEKRNGSGGIYGQQYVSNPLAPPSLTDPPKGTNKGTVDIIFGWYSDTLKAMYQKEPIADRPDTENGLMYVRSLTYIKRHLKDLGQKLGRTIDPAYIQGYLLTYTMTVDYAESFENQASITTYGKRRAETISLKIPDLTTLKMYGEAKIVSLSEVKKQGEISFRTYLKGVQKYPHWPKYGDVADVDLTFWGQGVISNVKIRQVQYTAMQDYCLCKVSTDTQPNDGTRNLIANLKRLEDKLKRLNQSQSAKPMSNKVTQSDSIGLTMGTPSYTLYTVQTMAWNGQPNTRIILQ